MICNAELTHWGIKGMKWGVRRYQNPDGSLTPAGKRRQEKLEAKEQKKAKKAQEERDKYEAEKKRVLASGSAKELLKYKGKLTQQEMQAAMQRIQWEDNVRNIAIKDVKMGKTKTNAVFAKIEQAKGYTETAAGFVNSVSKLYNAGAGLYNISASFYNAFNSSGNKLPHIDTVATSDGNKKNKHTDLKKLAKKSISEMSDDELNALVKRSSSEAAARKALEKLQED